MPNQHVRKPKLAPEMHQIDADQEGQRLDNFLISRLKGVPRQHIYRIIRKGEVRVNKGRRKPEYRLEEGDLVRIPPIRVGSPTAIPADANPETLVWLEEAILQEDKKLLVVNKPAGLAVHGGSGIKLGLIEALRVLRPREKRLELVHRLDRETSGCVLIAKRRTTLANLHEQFRSGHVHKEYIALVNGHLSRTKEVVEAPLLRVEAAAGERRVKVDPTGKEARTDITTERKFRNASLIRLKLHTGRMHQARVHCAHLGHAIAGDDRYGDREFNKTMKGLGLKRMFLHARELRFIHPDTGLKVGESAPLPIELEKLLEKLGEQ